MKSSQSYKSNIKNLFIKESLKACKRFIWKWLNRILRLPVVLYKRFISIGIDRFKLQQQKRFKKMCWTIRTLKYIVFICNLLTFIFGVATFIFSAVFINSLPKQNFNVGVMGFVVGLVASIIACFGLCGAYRESKSGLLTYTIFILLILIIELILIWIFNTKNFLVRPLAELQIIWLRELNYNNGTMARVEKSLKCCGVNGPVDYTNAQLIFPLSCYDKSTMQLHVNGCREVIIHIHERVTQIVNICMCIFCGFELSSVIFAVILARHFGTRNHLNYIVYKKNMEIIF